MAAQFDPRVFVRGPFRRCPACGAEEFGVYHVGGQQYTRRCRKCWHKGEFWLWPLSRKVIYIDQFAISNMMKTLNRAHPRHKAAKKDPFWLELFKRLGRLRDLQLAIYPHSGVHEAESLVSDAFDALKKMYEYFSYGISFQPVDEIAERQLNEAVLAWLRKRKPRYEYDPERVTSSGLNEWPGAVFVTVDMERPQSRIDAIRTFRDEVHRRIAAFFEEDLRTSKEKSFDYWLARERRISGEVVIQALELWTERIVEMQLGKVPWSLDNLYSSRAFNQYRLIHDVMTGTKVKQNEVDATIGAFLASDVFMDFPVNRISSLVWAAIDQAAAHGQAAPPNAGTANDIQVLCLQPYCDAMFVDNGCRALWEKIPRRYRPDYAKAKLFSPNTRDAFMVYLDQVEAEGDIGVLASVREAYGEPEPFLTLYDERPKREAD